MATPLTKVINPAAVSVVSDLKKLSDNTIVVLSSSSNPVAVVATPRNLLLLISVDRVMPLNMVANPAMAVCGVNSSALTIPTMVSLVINFNMLLFTPALSLMVSEETWVTPDPATAVGPINVHAVLEYTYSCELLVSNHMSPVLALIGCAALVVLDPTGLNLLPFQTLI